MYLSLHNATVQFGHNLVINDVDLEIEKGQCLILLGPSGCGKTTLLNTIAGAVALQKGRLLFNQRPLDDPERKIWVPMQQRGFATVFQDFSLWPHFSVGENVAFGLRIRRIPASERRNRVREALKKVRMEEFADRDPATLSGGQQQRIAIARALAIEPPLLLLDEPLSALDAALREELKEELARLLRDEGQTAVYVTHDQIEALSLGDRVALLREGKIEQCDAPEQIYRHPRTRFAARFIGAANVLPYRREGGQILLLDGRWIVPAQPGFRDRGWCFVRREDVRITAAESPRKTDGICKSNQFSGSRYEAVVAYPCGTRICGVGESGLGSGAHAHAIFDPGAVGPFDEEAAP